MTRPGDLRVQDLVEQALDLATLPTVASVTERTEANLRWANNALTTNGEMHGRTLTVTALAEVEGGTAAGTVSQEIAGPADVCAVVEAAEQLARSSSPSEDAMPLVTDYSHGDDWDAPSRRRPASTYSPTWPAGSARRSARRSRGAPAVRLRPARPLDDLSRQQHRTAAARGPADRSPRAEREDGRRSHRVGLGRPGHPRLRRRRRGRGVRGGEHRARLGEDEDRAAARTVRDAAAAECRCRPADLHLLDRERPRRRGGS